MSSTDMRGFHPVDIVVFAGTLLISIGIGVYHAFTGDRQKTTSDYFVGNRSMKTIPVALSMLVSFVSAILVLGTPAEVYTRGSQLVLKTVGYCLACIFSSVFLVPIFYNQRLTSSFEYLERRYQSHLVRLTGTFSMLLGNVFYMGLVLYTPSVALEAVTGVPLIVTIVLCAVVATAYTAIGGMRGVVWSDVFQAVVMIMGLLAIIILPLILSNNQRGSLSGGLSHAWQIASLHNKTTMFNFNPDPTQRLSFWSLVIGGCIHTLTIFGIGQTSVQRFSSLPTLSKARWSVFLNVPGLLVINILALLAGIVMFAYYTEERCDPLGNKDIRNANQLLPYFVVDVLGYPGLTGLFVAVLFCGALSSISSSLNAAAAVTWEDLLKKPLANLREFHQALVSKSLVALFGALSLIVAFLADRLGGHVLYASLAFTGANSGPCLGVFLLGVFYKNANAKGAMCGWLVSTVLCLWLGLGAFVNRPYSPVVPGPTDGCLQIHTNTTTESPLYLVTEMLPSLSSTPIASTPSSLQGWLKSFYSLSFMWYSTLGSGLTIIIGSVVSLITGGVKEPCDPALLVSWSGSIKSLTCTRKKEHASHKHFDAIDDIYEVEKCPLREEEVTESKKHNGANGHCVTSC